MFTHDPRCTSRCSIPYSVHVGAAKERATRDTANAPLFVSQRVGSTATGPRGRHGPGAGNVDGEWTHDLHSPHSAPSTPRGESGRNFHQSHRNQNGAPHSSSLAARITGSNPKRAAQVGRGLDGMNGIPTEPAAARATPRQDARASFNTGLTIRGLAGPYVVVAQNFVPGTTAGDIETAFGPHGGEIISCRLVKTHPILVAEIVFRSKEGADRVIATFDNQTVCPNRAISLQRL